MGWRERLFPTVGLVPLERLERESRLRQERAAKERLQGLTPAEMMVLAKRDPAVCEWLMAETTITSLDYATLASWRNGV